MFIQSLAFVALLVGPALAQECTGERCRRGFTNLNPGSLVRRQGQGFVPGTTPGCPADWPFCGTSGICYLPSRGDTCCPGGTYACPGGSFCLVAPYCCPNGLDPQSCAEQHGVTLPAGYSSGATQPPASTPSLVPTGASTLPTVIPTPPLAHQNSTTAGIPTVPTVPTTSFNPLFTGGTSSQNILSGAAALAGVVGFLGNIL